jgi:hypothetical protein
MTSRETMYEIERPNGDKICFSLGDFKERTYLDIRVFYIDQATGDLRPTKKGITVSDSLLSEFKKGLSACEKQRK